MRRWALAIVWTAIVLSASNDLFSAAHTGSLLAPLLQTLLGRRPSDELFQIVHFLIRKLAHLTEYGIASAIYFRALRDKQSGWALRWALGAVVIAATIASADEFHQSFVPSRTGTVTDVLLDTTGATIAQVIGYGLLRRSPKLLISNAR